MLIILIPVEIGNKVKCKAYTFKRKLSLCLFLKRQSTPRRNPRFSRHLEGTGRSNHPPCPLFHGLPCTSGEYKGCIFEWTCFGLCFARKGTF